MSKLNAQLQRCQARAEIGLMTHVVVGYPSLEATVELVRTMAAHGVDVIELQIPFSDPLADGPTIMQACDAALAAGTTVADALQVMKQLSREVNIPLLFMAYYNTVFAYGVAAFCAAAKAAGAAGLIVPDMPLEEETREGFFAACRAQSLHHIQVVSPVTTTARLQLHAQRANGFVYCTARQGITGVQETLPPEITSYLTRVRAEIPVPLAVGFGISEPAHLLALTPHADLAVVGSAVVRAIGDARGQEMLDRVAAFLSHLRGQKNS